MFSENRYPLFGIMLPLPAGGHGDVSTTRPLVSDPTAISRSLVADCEESGTLHTARRGAALAPSKSQTNQMEYQYLASDGGNQETQPHPEDDLAWERYNNRLHLLEMKLILSSTMRRIRKSRTSGRKWMSSGKKFDS